VVDFSDDVFEEVEVSFVGVDDTFPVPLVDVGGVDVVECFFVGSDGDHVGVESFAGLEAVIGEYHSFPFGEGEDDFGVGVGGFDVECGFVFDAVEVVVDAGACFDEERGGDALEAELLGEAVLEGVFNELDAFFGFSE